MTEFACDECLINSCCSMICEKVLKIPQSELKKCLDKRSCPDCGSFIPGLLTKTPLTDSKMKCPNCKHEFHKTNTNCYARAFNYMYHYNGFD